MYPYDDELSGEMTELAGGDAGANVSTAPRRFPLGILATLGAAVGAVATFTVRPQVRLFRIDRMILGSDSGTLGAVSVTDLKVGKDSQFVVSGTPIPLEAFARDAVGVELNCDTGGSSFDIVISFVNNTAVAQTVRGAIYGMSTRS